MVYKVSAIAASLGVTSLAVTAVYLRFHWHMQAGGEFPWAEAAATLLLTIGGAVSFGNRCLVTHHLQESRATGSMSGLTQSQWRMSSGRVRRHAGVCQQGPLQT